MSIRREKVEDTKDLKDQYQYRLIVRTSEVCTECLCLRVCVCVTGNSEWQNSDDSECAQVHSSPTFRHLSPSLPWLLPSLPPPFPTPFSSFYWKIPPAQSWCIKAKQNTGSSIQCSLPSYWAIFPLRCVKCLQCVKWCAGDLDQILALNCYMLSGKILWFLIIRLFSKNFFIGHDGSHMIKNSITFNSV